MAAIAAPTGKCQIVGHVSPAEFIALITTVHKAPVSGSHAIPTGLRKPDAKTRDWPLLISISSRAPDRASQTTLAHMTPPQSGRLYGIEAGQDSDFMSAAVVGLTLRASLGKFF